MADRNEIISRLTEHDVQEIYRRLGVERFGSGGNGNWLVSCPWRDDRSPSLNIPPPGRSLDRSGPSWR